VKDEKDDLLADPHSILHRLENYFSQFLYVHSDSDVEQLEIHALVCSPSRLEVKIGNAVDKV
jgi:hypothetical protein